MIKNYICKDCDHCFVCGKRTAVDKFSNDIKTPIGVDIEMIECMDFKNKDE